MHRFADLPASFGLCEIFCVSKNMERKQDNKYFHFHFFFFFLGRNQFSSSLIRQVSVSKPVLKMADIVSVLEPAPVSIIHFIIRMMLYVGTFIKKMSLYADRSSQLWLPRLSSALPSWRHLSADCWNTTVRRRNF